LGTLADTLSVLDTLADTYTHTQVLLIESDLDVIAFLLRRLSPVHRHIFVAGGTRVCV